MKLTTNFWSEEVHDFDTLLYINNRTKEIIYQADLKNRFQTYVFFKDIAKFVKTKTVRKSINDFYQFAVMMDGKITCIKWFDLHIAENVIVSHDIAFETTLIKRNDIKIHFGHFPMYYFYHSKNIKLPLYREFNIKARAYKYVANQIKKCFNK